MTGPDNHRHGCAEDERTGDAPREAPHKNSGSPGNSSHKPHHKNRNHSKGKRNGRKNGPSVYGALDLGTNNCRLLVAQPTRRGFRVIDAFSRIIRLGEGVTRSGALSQDAMERTIGALKVCSGKMANRGVHRSRVIATQACRIAENSDEFIARVREETGLDLEIISGETEARLAVSGCASLLDPESERALVFDIGGGSSELIWLDLTRGPGEPRNIFHDRLKAQERIRAWTSLPLGVVTLSERHGGCEVTPEIYEAMIDDVTERLEDFETRHGISSDLDGRPFHFLGTSGTVTTIAGVHLDLPAYNRNKIDGCWLNFDELTAVTSRLKTMSYDERAAQPCIGRERADLVLAGCAILEAFVRKWPCKRLRVADRGLREGILATLMAEDGHHQRPRRRRSRRRGRKPGRKPAPRSSD